MDDKVRSLPAGAEAVIEEIDIPFLPGRAPGRNDDNKEADEHSSEWKTETGEDFTQ